MYEYVYILIFIYAHMYAIVQIWRILNFWLKILLWTLIDGYETGTWVEYSGNTMISMPGKPCFIPRTYSQIFSTLPMTSSCVCMRGICIVASVMHV